MKAEPNDGVAGIQKDEVVSVETDVQAPPCCPQVSGNGIPVKPVAKSSRIIGLARAGMYVAIALCALGCIGYEAYRGYLYLRLLPDAIRVKVEFEEVMSGHASIDVIKPLGADEGLLVLGLKYADSTEQGYIPFLIENVGGKRWAIWCEPSLQKELSEGFIDLSAPREPED